MKEMLKGWWSSQPKEDKVFWVFCILLVVDCIVPDPLPFVDEILFGGGTVVSGVMRSFMKKKASDKFGLVGEFTNRSDVKEAVKSAAVDKVIQETSKRTGLEIKSFDT